MISAPVLLDTGPLVAILNENDQHHDACVQQAREIRGALFSTWLVITEAAWLLRHEPAGVDAVLRAVSDGRFRCLHMDRRAADWMREVAQKYKDLSPQLADLSLLCLAEQRKTRHVFTLDRRDISVYRTSDGRPLDLLPPLV